MTFALCLALLLASAPSPGLKPAVTETPAESAEALKRNVEKVDQAIAETERLIATSSDAPYLPDLQFRLAELVVEKSRYVFRLQAQTRAEGVKGPVVSTQTKLLKQKAMQIYDRILTVFPNYRQADKVTFYLAHEQRELGNFEDMLGTLRELIRKYPSSPLRLESEQILGDYAFDKSDNVEAEKHYLAVLSSPPSPVHDLARYKMGWIRINQSKHAEAVTFFEAAAESPPIPGVDPGKSLNVKREALLDLVYSYTEVKPAKGAIAYFERLCDSPLTCAGVLEKLANRYFIKQQYELAVPVFRRLLEIQANPKLDAERVFKLDDALRLAKSKALPRAEDIAFVVRAAVGVRTDLTRNPAQKKKELADLEETARDMATKLHLAAQAKEEKALFAEAALAYRHYLSLFRPAKHLRTLMQNRADALYAAGAYFDAGKQFEELARLESSAKQERALYGAVLSYTSALQKSDGRDKLTAFTKHDSRQAVKQLGTEYSARFAKSEHVPNVRFNIARAYYDDGEFALASDFFTAFALTYPEHKDAQTASYLALDGLKHLQDFEGIEAVGKKLLASRLPSDFREKLKEVLVRSRTEALDALALRGADQTGDVVEGLAKVAEQNKGLELGEKALLAAVTAAREEKDLVRERKLAQQFLAQYPSSSVGAEILGALGRSTAEATRFTEAAGYFEQAAKRLGKDVRAVEVWRTAANLHAALGNTSEALRDFQLAAAQSENPAQKSELMAQFAEAAWKGKDEPKARSAANAAFSSGSVRAAALLAEMDASSGAGEVREDLVGTLASGSGGEASDAAARGLFYVGEVLFRRYKSLPAEPLEDKVQALQQLDALYTQTASAGSAEWAIGAMWRAALAYQHLGELMASSSVPQGASAAEAAQWRAAMKEQAAALTTRADETFKVCVSKADSLGVYTTQALGCRKHADGVHPSSPSPSARFASISEEIVKQAEQKPDGAALEALGIAYLATGRVPLAQLTLGRAIELGSRPSAHNALGLAALLMGDPMSARAAYEKAIESGGTDKAYANLAALKCRYGDVEGAKRELSRIRSVDQLKAPDVDSQWRACR
jgi:cellulose synthase operon protein C